MTDQPIIDQETGNSKALALKPSKPMTIAEVKDQVDTIQKIMKSVMHEGQHFGIIKGCGDKPFLFQPGAQKIALTFRLRPMFATDKSNLPNGHREYEMTCSLENTEREVVGQGVGVCSSMESKYRYRTKWVDGKKIKVENENPADQFNTVKKMAAKRAMVHAVINTTAASDIFTQDEDYVQEQNTPPASTGSPPARQDGQGLPPCPKCGKSTVMLSKYPPPELYCYDKACKTNFDRPSASGPAGGSGDAPGSAPPPDPDIPF